MAHFKQVLGIFQNPTILALFPCLPTAFLANLIPWTEACRFEGWNIFWKINCARCSRTKLYVSVAFAIPTTAPHVLHSVAIHISIPLMKRIDFFHWIITFAPFLLPSYLSMKPHVRRLPTDFCEWIFNEFCQIMRSIQKKVQQIHTGRVWTCELQKTISA